MECLVDLPDHAHDLGDALTLTRSPWQTLIDALTAGGVKFQQKCEVIEANAKPAASGLKRGPKPGSKRTPQLHPALPQPSLADAAE